jgi:putative hydrolase of the HAD superfamily
MRRPATRRASSKQLSRVEANRGDAMKRVTAVFCDVGGVLLTNGWERPAREEAAKLFGLDWEDYQQRHERVVSDFETGRMNLDEYLADTVFFVPRPFTVEAFRTFMWNQSQPYPEALAFIAELAQSRKYLMATLNNESKELNRYRIEHFHLADLFTIFVSSCFVGVRKPDEKIYSLALGITQRSPGECVFIDDRPANVESARALGIQGIQYSGPEQLGAEFEHINPFDTRE